MDEPLSTIDWRWISEQFCASLSLDAFADDVARELSEWVALHELHLTRAGGWTNGVLWNAGNCLVFIVWVNNHQTTAHLIVVHRAANHSKTYKMYPDATAVAIWKRLSEIWKELGWIENQHELAFQETVTSRERMALREIGAFTREEWIAKNTDDWDGEKIASAEWEIAETAKQKQAREEARPDRQHTDVAALMTEYLKALPSANLLPEVLAIRNTYKVVGAVCKQRGYQYKMLHESPNGGLYRLSLRRHSVFSSRFWTPRINDKMSRNIIAIAARNQKPAFPENLLIQWQGKLIGVFSSDPLIRSEIVPYVESEFSRLGMDIYRPNTESKPEEQKVNNTNPDDANSSNPAQASAKLDDIPIWERIPKNNWDRHAVELLYKGYKDEEIAAEINRELAYPIVGRTVTNRLSALRRQYPFIETREQLRQKAIHKKS